MASCGVLTSNLAGLPTSSTPFAETCAGPELVDETRKTGAVAGLAAGARGVLAGGVEGIRDLRAGMSASQSACSGPGIGTDGRPRFEGRRTPSPLSEKYIGSLVFRLLG